MRKVAWLVALFAMGGSSSCRQVECGEGTVERDGVCVAGMDVDPNECGQGFFYDPSSGQCLSTAFNDAGFGICGPNTVTILNDAGVPVCIGTGTPDDCSSFEPPCPIPTISTKFAVCGRIWDIEDTTAADDDPAAQGGIAEVVELLLYEPIGFALGSRDPLPYTVAVDNCGYYSVNDVSNPGSGYLAVATDDPTGGATDDFALTGVAFPIPSPGSYRVNAWITRKTTVTLWNDSAADGTDFETQGVFVPIFLDARVDPTLDPYEVGAPMAGLSIERLGSVFPDDDYYFTDMDPFLRRTVSTTQAVTGMNGTGLMINSSLGNHGAFGEPAGCNVVEAPAASPAGVIFVSERPMECM
jgi:hypothetical protein